MFKTCTFPKFGEKIALWKSVQTSQFFKKVSHHCFYCIISKYLMQGKVLNLSSSWKLEVWNWNWNWNGIEIEISPYWKLQVLFIVLYLHPIKKPLEHP